MSQKNGRWFLTADIQVESHIVQTGFVMEELTVGTAVL
jgi:hypothetical protein